MRYNSLTFLLAVLMSIVCSTAFAHDFEVDGIYYKIIPTIDNDNTVEVTYKGNSPLQYNEYIGHYTIPSSVVYNTKTYYVTAIGANAFNGCTNLHGIDIPEGITSIGWSAFDKCSGLVSITIPNSVAKIGEQAFYCCDLHSINIPNSVTDIGEGAFLGCSSLETVSINSNNIASKAYTSDKTLSSIFGSFVTAYIFGEDVNSIGAYACYSCKALTSVTIPNSVTSIGDNAFRDCIGLTSVVIPNNVTQIGGEAFSNCSSLTTITIPGSVTSIGWFAFAGCRGLTSVIIGNGVSGFDSYVFSGCTSLTDFYCFAEEVPYAYDTFYGLNVSNLTLHVPSASLEVYKTTAPWSDFGNIVALTDEEITLGELRITDNKKMSNDEEIYDLGGRKLSLMQKGINIIRMKDGSTRKVLRR